LSGAEPRPGAEVEVSLPALDPPGSTHRQQVDWVVPPNMPGGRYTVVIEAEGGAAARVGCVTVRQRDSVSLRATDVNIARPMWVDLDDGVRLLGYDVAAEALAPGDTLYLTLYWQAREPVGRRYKVFTHLLGEVYHAETGNWIWGQQDNEPVNDTRPTSTWRTGEVIVDPYAIALPETTPAGDYVVEIGLYDPATVDRLPVVDAQGRVVADHVVLTHVTVESLR
jgi:hypothetical protein